MCNVDPEWCGEGRKKKRERNGGRKGYLYPSSGLGKQGNCGGRRVSTQKGRCLLGKEAKQNTKSLVYHTPKATLSSKKSHAALK
ncbi:hypothetical protein ACN38_g5658 [Penicillium nordicum]|uniref:Uncharacterized protein n=1 Tax=Penicillium nordicum TaxID=229535 RepID=A0A0M9WG20_9EURO|nr:hypothetical protein ACN38_g5658 [Penicillium nordicum]